MDIKKCVSEWKHSGGGWKLFVLTVMSNEAVVSFLFFWRRLMSWLQCGVGTFGDKSRNVLYKLSVRERFNNSDCGCHRGRHQFLCSVLAVQHPCRGSQWAVIHGPTESQLPGSQRRQCLILSRPWFVGAMWCWVSVVLAERLHATEASTYTTQLVIFTFVIFSSS